MHRQHGKSYASRKQIPPRRQRVLQIWPLPIWEDDPAIVRQRLYGRARKTMPRWILYGKPLKGCRKAQWRRYRSTYRKALHSGEMIPRFRRDWCD